MKIDIAKDDVWYLRNVVSARVDVLELHDKHLNRKEIVACRKFVRKMNRACVKIYGHDCVGHMYNG